MIASPVHKYLNSMKLTLFSFLLSTFSYPVFASTATAPIDPHTFANLETVRVTHMSLDLNADFDKKTLSGSVILSLNWLKAADELILDSDGLNIAKIEGHCQDKWQATEFTQSSRDEILGEAIHISLNNTCDKVKVYYATSPSAQGLQWLSPELTATKKQPFLFTQSEAIMGRSWLPMQDTPAIKITYDAVIHTPKELRAVMSADFDHKAPLNGSFEFDMPQPIAPYLIALTIGDLHYHAWNARTGVWAEPNILEAAAKEFEDTEAMIKATEKSFGPYPFGQYDLLILPPSFPFGGMENPKLTFVTPTVIVGDKSLVSLISHELAHSWSGNLVTNARWADLWLNEGITTYLENRILEVVYGKDKAKIEQVLAYQELEEEMKETDDKFQGLVLPLKGENPDDGFSDIPYTKGQLFMLTLEQDYGRRNLDNFLKSYFKKFSFKTITTPEFIDYLQIHLLTLRVNNPMTNHLIDLWLYQSGLPKGHYQPHSKKLDAVSKDIELWKKSPLSPEKINSKNWSSQEFVFFLNNLHSPISLAQLSKLDEHFHFTQTHNSEIALAWFTLVVKNDYRDAFPALKDYLKSIGRRRLIVPLYNLLASNPSQCAWGQTAYADAREGYHPLTQSTVDKFFKCEKQPLYDTF